VCGSHGDRGACALDTTSGAQHASASVGHERQRVVVLDDSHSVAHRSPPNTRSSSRCNIVNSANTGGISEEEIQANQLEIDSAIESIKVDKTYSPNLSGDFGGGADVDQV
jgi:hypothetical protein